MEKFWKFIQSDLAEDIIIAAGMLCLILIGTLVIGSLLLFSVAVGHGLYYLAVLCLWSLLTVYVRKSRNR